MALLTDFGTADIYVGVMKGVVAEIAPGAAVTDLSHEIPAQDVRAAASALLFSYRYFPAGTVFCCVVDPGVGTARRAVAVELGRPAGDRAAIRRDSVTVVCPDNGLLTPLLEQGAGATRAVVLDDPAYHLARASATFHGRDIFAPVAAHLAAGVELTDLGSTCDPDGLARLPWPRPQSDGDGWTAEVIHVDRFGNLITNLPGTDLAKPFDTWRVTLGERSVTGVRATFGEVAVGEPVAYVGSSGYLEVAVRQGSAAREWPAGRGSLLRVERARG
ncbi:MAG: SAM-dependent chlorinase/fluorinase [Trueperaceae bacterium]